MNRSGIYEILNTVNGKRYIGSATRFNKRFSAHRCYLRQGAHHSFPLQRAWDKYGEDAFNFAPLLICLRGALLDYEQRCIDGLKPEYNISSAADNAMRGRKHSKETKAKIGVVQKGKLVSVKTRERIGAASIGRKASFETRAKISASLRGNKYAVGSKGHLGMKASLELRARLSAAHKGVSLSPAHKAAMSAAQTIRWARLKASK